MSEVLILEFDGATADHYQAVNQLLGVDPNAGEGDLPRSLLTHVAAQSAAGLVVVEVWESRSDQAEFMKRLGPALATAGLPDPRRSEWMTLVGRSES